MVTFRADGIARAFDGHLACLGTLAALTAETGPELCRSPEAAGDAEAAGTAAPAHTLGEDAVGVFTLGLYDGGAGEHHFSAVAALTPLAAEAQGGTDLAADGAGDAEAAVTAPPADTLGQDTVGMVPLMHVLRCCI